MSVYEERQLLKLLESCPEAVDADPVARRLRRKLLVRQVRLKNNDMVLMLVVELGHCQAVAKEKENPQEYKICLI